MDSKIEMPIENIIILLTKENIKLVPQISNGLCDNCYFWSNKNGDMTYDELSKNHNAEFHCPTGKNIIPCSQWVIDGKCVNVIFIKEK
jgi:hypothetical protein